MNKIDLKNTHIYIDKFIIIFLIVLTSCESYRTDLFYNIKSKSKLNIPTYDSTKSHFKFISVNDTLVGEILKQNDSTWVFMDYTLDSVISKWYYVNGVLNMHAEKRYVDGEWKVYTRLFIKDNKIDTTLSTWFTTERHKEKYVVRYFGFDLDSIVLLDGSRKWYSVVDILDAKEQIGYKIYKGRSFDIRKEDIKSFNRINGILNWTKSNGDVMGWPFWFDTTRLNVDNDRFYNFEAKTQELKELGFDFIK